MSDPIRVLHFADLHIGMENYGRLDPATGTSSRVRDFLARLDEVIDYALENDADLVVFAGDAFKNRDPDPTQQREFAQRIKRLANAIPTLLVVGNHDMPVMPVKASSVDIFRALDVPGVIVGHKAEARVLETRRGPLFLAWIPYPMRNRLLARDEHQGKSLEELELALRQVVSDLIAELAHLASAEDMPRLLAGHFSVAEASLGSERTVMLGRDVAVQTSALADPVWDYVALGHIHRHQNLHPSNDPPVVYSGSLERIDFGEEGEAKGFCWVELARRQTAWSFIPVAARRFITLQVDVRGTDTPTETALQALGQVDVHESVVRIQVLMDTEQQAAFREREIREALCSATSLAIGREVDMEARARLGDLAPETLTPLQLIERYFIARNEPPERIQVLMHKAEELVRDSD